MTLIPNVRAVLLRAWTPRLIATLGIVNSVYLVTDMIVATMPVPPIWLATANGLLALITFGARLIDQNLGATDEPS